MLTILMVESGPDVGRRCAAAIEAEDFQIQHTMGCDNHLSVLHYIEQNRPDVIVIYDESPTGLFCMDLMLAIRGNGIPTNMVVISRQRTTELLHVALDCDVEWLFCVEDEMASVPRALYRIMRRKNALQKEREERNKQLFCDYMTGQRTIAPEELESVFKDYCGCDLYQAAIVRILPPYRRRYLLDENNLVILKGYHILRERLSHSQHCVIIKNGLDIILCVMGKQRDIHIHRTEMQKFLRDMREFEATVSSVRSWVSLGATVSQLRDLPESYRVAKQALEERILHENKLFFENDQMAPSSADGHEGQFWMVDVRKTLENSMETFDLKTIHKTLEQLKSNLRSSMNLDGKGLHIIFKNLISIIFRELERKGIGAAADGLDYETIIKEWDYFWTVQDLFDCVESYFSEAVEIIKKQEENSVPAAIMLAKRYIRSYFDMPLSLQEISDYVGLNENYFSYYFKKNVNMTFKQYQTQLRIRHAKQLLLDKKLTLEEIAESVGYSDVKYFSRVFKQVAKVSPGEYRKKYHIIGD